MATPRKNWLKVEEDTCDTELTNEELGFAVRLMSLMNKRRARNDLDASAACRTRISKDDLRWLTGREKPAAARQQLVAMSLRVSQEGVAGSLTISEEDGKTFLSWENLNVYQGWPPGSRAEATRELPSPIPIPIPIPIPKEGKEEEKSADAPAAAPAVPFSDPEQRDEGPTAEEERAAKAKLEVDVNRALRLLTDQPGDLAEKRAWLTAEIRSCEAWCKEHSKPFPSGLLSWWKRRKPATSGRAAELFAQEFKTARGTNTTVPTQEARGLEELLQSVGEQWYQRALQCYFDVGKRDDWIQKQGFSARQFCREWQKMYDRAQKRHEWGKPMKEIPWQELEAQLYPEMTEQDALQCLGMLDDDLPSAGAN